ncbi:MAG: Fe-Mn family superoxide dismutase [bacterium]
MPIRYWRRSNEYAADAEKHAYALGEIQRRFGFEYNGMRNHEVYFQSLSGGAKPLAERERAEEGHRVRMGLVRRLARSLQGDRSDPRHRLGHALLRPGKKGDCSRRGRRSSIWGSCRTAPSSSASTCGEHAYVYDYPTSEKKKYVEAFFENLNWEAIEENLKNAQ